MNPIGRWSTALTLASMVPLVVATGASAADQPTSEVGTVTAQAAQTPAPTPQSYQAGDAGVGAYFLNWFNRVDAAQASQPHWMTPLVTVTPRLEEEFRYDQYWQRLGNGGNVNAFDSGKGLELIPTETNELLLNLPPYQQRIGKKPAEGWADWPILTVKQRLLSANEQNGNYIVTAFLGVQAPTGVSAFTNDAYIITPTIAGGKGWGKFDFQTTLGVALPTGYHDVLGDALTWNIAFQYHVLPPLWPQVEVNLTHWYGGERDARTQIFITPGIILGRFPLAGRLNLAVGLGYQVAVSPKLVTSPALTPTYNHAWIATVRTPF